MKAGEDEYSDDDGLVTTKEGKPIPKFRLPKRLRGWMYLERVRIPPRDVPGLLNQIKTTNITRLQSCLVDAYPESLLKKIDSDRSNHPSRKPEKINSICTESDNQEEEGYDDANQVENGKKKEIGINGINAVGSTMSVTTSITPSMIGMTMKKKKPNLIFPSTMRIRLPI